MPSTITQRGATGPFSLTANGTFQQQSQTQTLYGNTATDTSLSTLLGSRWDLSDGREVRLVLVGASNVASGLLVAAPAPIANHQNLVTTAFSAYTNNGLSPATVTVTLGGTAATANEYAGGYAVVTTGTGLGQTLKIASHPAQASTTGALVITLADAPNTALDTTSTVSLIANPCNGIIINNHTALQQPVGVTLYAITATNYAYVISKGVTSCLQDGASTVGSEISPSNGVDGAIENGVIAQGFVGIQIVTGVDTHYQPILVNI